MYSSGMNFSPILHAASRAGTAVRSGGTGEIKLLKLEIERLLMITEAMWTMLQEEFGYDDNKLIEYIARIDLRDGKLDGRVSTKKGPKECRHCGRPVSKKRPICFYCGNIIIPEPFAR